MIDSSLLNAIANPKTFQLGNPLEESGNALNTVLLMEKVTDSRTKRRKTQGRNTLMQMPGVANEDGSVNRPVYRKNAIAGGYADLLPDQEDQWIQEDKAAAELGKFKADVSKTTADTSLVQANTIAKKMESLKPLLGTVQNAQQYVQLVHSDPDISRSLTERQMGPEQLTAALSRLTPEQFQKFILAQRVGDKEAMQNHYTTANRGGTGAIYQMPQYGTPGVPKEVASWNVTPNPNAYGSHWVQDYDPVTKKIVHRIASPGMATNPIPPKVDPAVKAMEAALAKRNQAASAVAAEVKKFGQGNVIVHPETGDIEIQGALPMSPVAQRRLDLLAGELGGQLEMVDGQNPRVVLHSGTTLGQVQNTLRAKAQVANNLVLERDQNQVERYVPKAPGVIRMPALPKDTPADKLRAQAQTRALQRAKQEMNDDPEQLRKWTDEYYQDLLIRPGAGYGGPDPAAGFFEDMKRDREARRGTK